MSWTENRWAGRRAFSLCREAGFLTIMESKFEKVWKARELTVESFGRGKLPQLRSLASRWRVVAWIVFRCWWSIIRRWSRNRVLWSGLSESHRAGRDRNWSQNSGFGQKPIFRIKRFHDNTFKDSNARHHSSMGWLFRHPLMKKKWRVPWKQNECLLRWVRSLRHWLGLSYLRRNQIAADPYRNMILVSEREDEDVEGSDFIREEVAQESDCGCWDDSAFVKSAVVCISHLLTSTRVSWKMRWTSNIKKYNGAWILNWGVAKNICVFFHILVLERSKMIPRELPDILDQSHRMSVVKEKTAGNSFQFCAWKVWSWKILKLVLVSA